MSIELKKDAIEKAYPGEKWKKKVAKMSPNQILAVYNRMLDSRQLK
jgi:hypothetical protein